jgi:Domain of unknown function (DUF4471)
MSSFIPGKKKRTGDSIMIRGFWGDIINSPYAAFGYEVLDEVDREKFFRKLNYQRIYMAADISGYNVQGYIHKLETLKPYEFPFERLRRVEESYGAKSKKVKDKDGNEKIVDASSDEEEDKKEEEEEKKEEKLGEIKEVENEDEDVAGKAEEVVPEEESKEEGGDVLG